MNQETASQVGNIELTVGQCATLACLLEATAPKPGNVHRSADFEDLSFTDLVVSAVAIGPCMEEAAHYSVGTTVLGAVRATCQLVHSNANLGVILLLAPIATVSAGLPLRLGVKDVLSQLTADDAAKVYEAIRLARPGGLGAVATMDVAGQPPPSLLEAMADAQDRDLIARQYVNGFEQVFDCVAAWLCEGYTAGWSLTDTIVRAHVRLMADFPDSLIARKCGGDVAKQAQHRAAQTLAAGCLGDENYERALGDLDFWLRCDGHRRNPGTTADLIAAGLFVVLRERMITPRWR